VAEPGGGNMNVEILEQINKLLREQQVLIEKINAQMGASANISQSLSEAQREAADTTKTQADNLRDLNSAMAENTGGAEGLTSALGRNRTSSNELNESWREGINTAGNFVTAAGMMAAGIAGMSAAADATKVVFSLFGGGITSLSGIVTGAVGVVGSFFSGLMGAAADYYNKTAKQMMAANEAIRGSFGDLESNQGAAVKGMAKNLDTYKKAVSSAGGSTFTTLGDMAAVLGAVKEVAEGFGNSFVRLQEQVVGATSEIFLMKKGMGLGAEAMKQLASEAEATGTTLQAKLQESMVTAAHLSDQFGVDVKSIGKNFDQMAADVGNFGHLAPKTLMATAAYAAKLGVEVKSLTGLMDGFDTFESAAQNAGKLAEAFGMNVDVMGMMNAENPAERMDMLRKSFEDTGKSVSDLSRHELKMLSDSMGGMPVDELKNALSMSTDDMGFGDMEEAAEEAAEKMTPEKAMEKVAKSIEKMTNAMTDMTSGPFSEFMRGLMQVIERSPEFRTIMKDIGKWLKEFFKLGKVVGQLFVDTFLTKGSAMRDMINGIFDLKKIKKFTGALQAAFGEFFKLVKSDPKKAIEDLFDKVHTAFKDWFGSGETASNLGNMIKDMLINGLKMLGGLAPKIIKTASKYIKEFTTSLKDYLAGDNETANTIGAGLSGAFVEAFKSIGGSLMNDLLPVLWDLFKTVFWALAPTLAKILIPIWTFILVKSLISAAIAAMAGAVLKQVAFTIVGALSKVLGMVPLPGPGGPGPGGGGDATSLVDTVKNLMEALAEIDVGTIWNAAKALLIMAGTFSIALLAMGVSMVLLAAAFSLVKFKDVMKAMAGTTFAVLTAIVLFKALKVMGTPGANEIKGMLALALVLGVGGTVLGAAAFIMMLTWSHVDAGKFAASMAALTFSAILAIPLTLALMAMSIFLTPITAAIIGLGILALSAVLIATSLIAIPAAIFATAWSIVDVGAFIAGMGLLASTVGMTISFVAAMITLGIVIIAGMVPLLVGINAYLWFMITLAAVSDGLASSMQIFYNNFMKVDVKKLAMAYGLLIGTVVGTLVMVGAGIALGAMSMWMLLAIPGIWAAAGFWATIALPLIGMMKVLETISKHVGDPDKMVKTIEIIGRIIGAIASLAALGIEASKFGKVSKSVGKGSGAADATNSVSGFIKDSLGAMMGLLDSLKEISVAFSDEKVLKGATAVAGLIEAIAGLAAALVGPLIEIMKNKDAFKDKEAMIAAMDSGQLMVSGILKAIRVQLPKIVKSLLSALDGIKASPRTIKKKAEALKAIFEGLAAMISSVSEIKEMSMRGTGKEGETTFDRHVLLNLFRQINLIISDPVIGELIQNAVAITNQVKYAKTMASRMKSVADFVQSTMTMIESLGKLGTYLSDGGGGGTNGLINLRNHWDYIMADGNNLRPSSFIVDMQEEVQEIKKNWKGLNYDLGNVEMKPLIDGMLGSKGNYTLAIVPEAVNLTVKLNVSVDSKELAVSIAKGNEDTGGFFQTTQQVDRAALDLDGGAG